MNTMADGESQERAVPTGPTKRPGHELGAARERAGLSTEEMATRLHLSRDHLEALERDDYTHLPTATFVRGYLRAYAREVGMDGDELVAEFDAVCGHPEAPELVISPGVEDPAKASGSMVAVMILAAVVVISALAWWFQQGAELPPSVDTGMTEPVQETDEASAGMETDSAAASDTEAGAEADSEAVETEADSEAVEGESAEGAGAASADIAEPDESTTGADGGVASEDSVAVDDSAAAETAGDTTDQGDEPETMAAGETEATATGEQGADDSAAESQSSGPLATSDASLAASDAAATGPDRLEVRVDGESWLEVYDSRGRRLVYTLYSGASPIVVNGWAPFDVYLGNAPDVTVEFGDTEIDPSAFVRSDNTARFRADAEGARSR